MDGQPVRDGDFEAFERLLGARYSCRAFLPGEVPRTDIRAIVAAAQQVPSWCNSQPWQLTVLGGETLAAFRDVMTQAALNDPPEPDLPLPEAYLGTYKDRRRTCGFQLYDAAGIARDDRQARAAQMMRNYVFFDAPQVAIVTTPRALGAYGALDCGAFVSAFMVAAEGRGVASIAQGAIAPYAPAVRRFLGISEDRLVLCAISFGYADPDAPVNRFRTERASVDEVVEFR
ncbi:nitroreductase [Mesobacterium pallidum]|uniref:nitroreductase n=1 Tax=Mesobacterium pallidum TaxID=2872037 RepID=UPI001EE172AC|nr:nitroreductase [Mesobacterium pallidum]